MAKDFLKLENQTDMSVNVRVHENEKGNYYFQNNHNIEEVQLHRLNIALQKCTIVL